MKKYAPTLSLFLTLAITSCATNTTPATSVSSNGEVNAKSEKESVKNVIRSHALGFKSCYEAEIMNNENISGKIVVEFEIDDQGLAKNSQIKNSTMHNAAVEECVLNVISKAKFSPAPKGTLVDVSYPFIFENIKK